jgi:hypothetical protein
MPETSGRCGVCTSDTSAGRRALAPCREQDPEVVAVDGAVAPERLPAPHDCSQARDGYRAAQ